MKTINLKKVVCIGISEPRYKVECKETKQILNAIGFEVSWWNGYTLSSFKVKWLRTCFEPYGVEFNITE